MVFGIFTRKSTVDDTHSSPEPKSNELAHSPLRFPTAFRAVLGTSTTDLSSKDLSLEPNGDHEESINPGSPDVIPPETPSPPPPDPKALYELIQSIPGKTLLAYTLSHIRPRTPLPSTSTSTSPQPPFDDHANSVTPPPSPDTIAKLSKFFSTLTPPPLLHCVRCHTDFFAIENEEKDKACRVPHDDESALVERVSGGGYETLWGCCGQTVDGDGGEGPPDGWCYEGRHTTDVKRARFRADSTIHNDKLTSCFKLNCHGVRSQLPKPDLRASPSRNSRSSPARKSNASPTRSHASASVVKNNSSRKRPRKSLKDASASASEDDHHDEPVRGRVQKKGSRKGKENADDSSMVIDDAPLPTSKPKSKPISHRARPPPSTSSTAASVSVSISHVKPLSSMTKPKSIRAKTSSRTLLSQSHTHLPSDSDTSSRAARPRTRSLVREESRVRPPASTRDTLRAQSTTRTTTRGQSRVRRTRKTARAATPSQTPSSEAEPEAEETDHEDRSAGERGRGRKKRRVAV